MRFVKALAKFPEARIFRVGGSHDNDQTKWDVEPADSPVLLESENLFIVKAKNVLPNGTIKDCYIDVSLPERINDYTYFFDGNSLDVTYSHEVDGDVICAVPIDCFGLYELFYSKINPDLGINILKEGLAICKEKHYIAEDLGYILRDEGRFNEAAEMFQIAADETPSSYFIYGELAACYEKIGGAGAPKNGCEHAGEPNRWVHSTAWNKGSMGI
jgi:tetratricopeptide (TPR) repeat protein